MTTGGRRLHRRFLLGTAAAVVVALSAACGASGAGVGNDAPARGSVSSASPAATASDSPASTAPPVEDLWTVDAVASDGRSVTVAYAAGGCTRIYKAYADEQDQTITVHVLVTYARARTGPGEVGGCTSDFAADRVTVRLPRALRSGESVSGACDASGDTTRARQCRLLRQGVEDGRTQPSTSASPPTEVK